MQMQLKMKELELEQFRFLKEKLKIVPLVSPTSTNYIPFYEVHHICSIYFGERSGQIVCSF
jgi:hypothetical protein